jgi:hypothetical protein
MSPSRPARAPCPVECGLVIEQWPPRMVSLLPERPGTQFMAQPTGRYVARSVTLRGYAGVP